MSVYAVAELMKQTRALAAEYYRTTSQTLPVSHEIAKYDAQRLLNLQNIKEAIPGVDFLNEKNERVQVKSRAIFKENLRGIRIGQLNLEAPWDHTYLVILNQEYQPTQIYAADHVTLVGAMISNDNPKRQKRGAMSLAKFIAVSECIWSCDDEASA